MKANELFVGAWVRVTCARNVPPNDIMSMLPRIGKVVGVNVDTVYVDFVDFGFMLDDVEPIPIVPEILEKNGFENINDYFVQHIDKWIVHIENTFTKMNLAIWKDKSIGCAIDIPVYYVHELQHALKLCGIDREITL